MMLERLRSISKNQAGFMLTEVLLAVLILGLVASSITMAISQMFIGSARSNAHMTAVKQVESAIYWIGRDAQMAEDVSTDSDPTGFPITLTWDGYGGSPQYEVVYSLVGNSLKRNYSVDGVETETIIADYIETSADKTSCEYNNRELTLLITATVGGWMPSSETRVSTVMSRPDKRI